MSNPEKDLYQKHIRPALAKIPGLSFDRVENSVACGVPDICYSYKGHHGWIELKVGHIRENGTLALPTMKGVQEQWLRMRHRIGGGHTFVIAEAEGRVYMYEGPDVSVARDTKSPKRKEVMAVFMWDRDTSPAELAPVFANIL